jgi:hypothetical protein
VNDHNEADKTTPDREFGRVFGTAWHLLSTLSIIHNVPMQSLNQGASSVVDGTVDLLTRRRDFDAIFYGQNAGSVVRRYQQTLKERYADTAQDGIKAACVVFAHGVIEEFVRGYLGVTASYRPDLWSQFVDHKKVEIHILKDLDYTAILRQRVQELLKGDVRRESLLAKLDRLHKVVPPQQIDLSHGLYSYDRDRIKNLDDMRHAIVHGNRWDAGDLNFSEELNYWHFLNMYCAILVHKGTDLRIMVDGVQEYFTWGGAGRPEE